MQEPLAHETVSKGAEPVDDRIADLGANGKDLHAFWPAWPRWPPDIASLVVSWGYPFEAHWLTTEDGYRLQAFRLPLGKLGNPAAQPVLLLHGLLDSSAAWVCNPPAESLAFILHDAGYDVWLGNVRGTTWGLHHTHLTTEDAAFWDFSWDDMAAKDLPAIFRHIADSTNRTDVLYVGHSQGTIIALAALSRLPELRDRVQGAVLLAPVAFVQHTRSTMLRMLAALHTERLIEEFGVHSFLPGDVDETLIFPQICVAMPGFCKSLIEGLVGRSDDLNTTRLPEYLHFVPAGTSVMNMEHWAQGVRQPSDGTLRMFDFGSDCERGHWGRGRCNQHAYNGSTEPRAYPLETIATPLALFSGGEDELSTPEDVELLTEALPAHTVVAHERFPALSHLDFTWGMHVHATVYPRVLAALARMAGS